MRVRIGHSPDPDDAFMMWALATGAVPDGGFDVEWHHQDIQTLNDRARGGELDVTALSAHAYPHVQDEYALLAHGSSMGRGYGPVVVAREPLEPGELRRTEIAVPGALTTAYLVLRLALGDVSWRAVPFDRILHDVREGRAEAGLVIHEGQLTYEAEGLVKCLDLGEWWLGETGLPLPLGVNAIRRSLPRRDDLSRVLRASIEASLAHRDEALPYALQWGRGLDEALADRFVAMYVNELTVDMGEEGRAALEELYGRAAAIGALPAAARLDVVE